VAQQETDAPDGRSGSHLGQQVEQAVQGHEAGHDQRVLSGEEVGLDDGPHVVQSTVVEEALGRGPARVHERQLRAGLSMVGASWARPPSAGQRHQGLSLNPLTIVVESTRYQQLIGQGTRLLPQHSRGRANRLNRAGTSILEQADAEAAVMALIAEHGVAWAAGSPERAAGLGAVGDDECRQSFIGGMDHCAGSVVAPAERMVW
jgi:hypothetical protein